MGGSMKIAVLDSDKQNLEIVSSLVMASDSKNKVWCYESVFSFVTGIYDDHSGDVDLVIIFATEETVEMAMDLHKFFPHILVAFYSDNVKLIEKTFEVDPIYFLYIPLNPERINKVINKAKEKLKNILGNSLVLSNKGRMVKLGYSSIKYVESDGRKIVIHTDEGFYDAYMKMEDIQEKLPNEFLRCHRCYIVNLERVVGLNSTDITLSSKERVPVSRSKMVALKSSLSEYSAV